MLLDCFTFFRELDLLEGRLKYLYDHVDYFIIVEADVTHSGIKKDLNFLNNIKRYRPYLDKIIYQPVSIDTTQFADSLDLDVLRMDSFSWKIEQAQRNHIGSSLKLFQDDAAVMISDLDEIPIKTYLDKMVITLKDLNAFSLAQRMYYYNFNQYSAAGWNGTVVAKNSFVKQQGVQWLRDMRWNIPKVENGGYHLSFWGSAEDIRIKIQNFAHQEFNTSEFNDVAKIKNRVENGIDPFDRLPQIESKIEDIDPEFYSVFSKYQHIT